MEKWVKVTDALPEIPEGKYGITVLVTMFDIIYEEINPGYGSYVTTSSFRDGIFKTLYYGDDDIYWGPCGDPVVAWQYMLEPYYTEEQNRVWAKYTELVKQGKVPFQSRRKSDSEAIAVLKAIIYDATHDSKDPEKRNWPIRAANYRRAVKVIKDNN